MSNLRLPWEKQSCPAIFNCIAILFYHPGFLSNSRLPWKQSLPWNFSRPGGTAAPPPMITITSFLQFLPFLDWKLFIFVSRAAIAYRYCTIKSHNGKSQCRQYKFQKSLQYEFVTSHWNLHSRLHPCIRNASGQGCQFGFFEAKFAIFGHFSTPLAFFYFWKKAKCNLAFFVIFWRVRFLCRFGRFLGTGRFLNTVSGHRMINCDWKLCTRICNFLFCLFHAFRFEVSCCSSAKPKVSRSLLMEWASSFNKKICVYCLSKARLGVLKVPLCIYLAFGFFRCYLAFLRVDLAFFAYDYLATLLQGNAMQLSKLLLAGSQFSSIRISIQYMIVVLPGARLLAFTHSKLRKWPFFDFKIQGGFGPPATFRRPWCHWIFKTFHRCFVNIYRYGFKSIPRRDLKSMHFVHNLTSILVNHSFFCWSYFCFDNTNTSIRSFVFFPY